MTIARRLGWVALALCCCNHKATYQLETRLTTSSTETTGLPGFAGHSLRDARPALTVTATDQQLAVGMREVLASSDRIQRSALTVTVETRPASLASHGTIEVTITANAVIARLPELSALSATIKGNVTYANLDARELGAELGKKVVAWLDDAKLPVRIGLPPGPVAPARTIAVGATTCSSHADGSLRCWSSDAEPVPLPGLDGTKTIEAANGFGACGTRPDGHVFCIDAWNASVALEAREVCGVERATAISVGQQTACALRGDGRVVCWGRAPEWYAPCDRGGRSAVEVKGVTDAVALDVGAFKGCAIRRDGTVACWEHCDAACKSGVVGRVDGPPTARALKGATGVTQLAVEFGVYIASGARIRYIPTDTGRPYEVTLPEPVQRIVPSVRNTCALGAGGHVFCFGPTAKPEPIPGLADIVSLDADLERTCAVTRAGAVLCWSDDRVAASAAPAPVTIAF